MKKYVLTLNEKQANALKRACTTFTKLQTGEFTSILEPFWDMPTQDLLFCSELLALIESKCTKKPKHCYPSLKNHMLVGEDARIVSDIYEKLLDVYVETPISKEGYPTLEVIRAND